MLLRITLLLLLSTISIFARRGVSENEFIDEDSASIALRESSKRERVTTPPPEHDTLESTFILYWGEKESKRLGRSVDTLESRVYISKFYNIFGVNIKESIEFGKIDVIPEDTDSIKFKEYIGYPSTAAQVWVFPRNNSEKIPLYSAHPDTALMLHYGFNTANIFPLPPRGKLITSNDSLGKPFDLLIADSLSRVPRAFIEYYNNIDKALQIYNRTPTDEYLPMIGRETIAKMSLEVLKLKRPRKRLQLLTALLSSDPNNQVALARMVEVYSKKDFATAQKFYNRLRAMSSDDDYLVLYAKGLLLEAQKDIEKARVLYDEAEALTFIGTPAYNLIHKAVLRITKLY